jgi:hypothetical protein
MAFLVAACMPPNATAAAGAASLGGVVDFERDIRPLIESRCLECHGPARPKSGLRLDTRAHALRGGDSGKPAIPNVPGGGGELLRRVTSRDPDEVMPPSKRGAGPLSDGQITLLRRWIDAGAPWPESSHLSSSRVRPAGTHWAFVAPTHRVPPDVKNSRWVRNPIDAFVLSRLEREGITPSAEADKSTLLRRLHLDLIGLPPTPEEVEVFVNDRREDAYERRVDGLLASPHFGERRGRHWLDLARYADSDGYQLDYVRPWAYVYRDWVVAAFNRDLPFDQFTIEQLAGDLLPGATASQRIATGFHRHTLLNNEDGVDKEEFRCKARVDRVATTGTAWLGLTLGCAECHSHKYDPISQREFYQMYAFFNRAEEDNFAVTPDMQACGFREATNAVKTFVHVRGDFLRHGEEVKPDVLAALNPMAAGAVNNPPTRLDLAGWLVDPVNPLTARVEANRVWQHLFGRGLVATPDDFGTRGEPPSHPELLDWMAIEFVRCGWSRKQLIRLVVMSSAYRQSSHSRAELVRRDPQNLLLARQNRFRVEAETVRDLHLAASGLLNPNIGGPTIRPPMPADLYQIGYVDRGVPWVESAGAARFRRGVYVQTQRTVQYPVAATFDTANPSESCPRREISNTPLQALTLLNNSVFFECAVALGGRMDEEGGRAQRDALARGFALCLGRPPSMAELDRLDGLFEQELRCAQAMMNLDEFLTRE